MYVTIAFFERNLTNEEVRLALSVATGIPNDIILFRRAEPSLIPEEPVVMYLFEVSGQFLQGVSIGVEEGFAWPFDELTVLRKMCDFLRTTCLVDDSLYDPHNTFSYLYITPDAEPQHVFLDVDEFSDHERYTLERREVI